MNISRRPKTQPSRRQVVPPGRTTAFSYHSRRSEQPASLGRNMLREALTARSAKQAARYWRQRFGLVIVLVALCLGLYQLLVLSSDPKVLPVDSSATFLHPLSTYHDTAQKLLSDSILNGNKLTVDANGISSTLRRQYPELSVVSVSLPLVGHRPIIYIAPADPSLLYITNDGHAFVVDSNGRAITQANPSAASSLHLSIVKDSGTASMRVGQLAVSSDTVAFIKQVVFQVQQKHLSVSTFVLPAGSSELDMYLDGQQYLVKFNLASDTAQEQVGDYLAVRHYLQSRGLTPVQYVDARIAGRAYYK